jgi:hypothetical protein
VTKVVRKRTVGGNNAVRECKAGHVVAQLVEALRYKPEAHGFDSRFCHWNFSLT